MVKSKMVKSKKVKSKKVKSKKVKSKKFSNKFNKTFKNTKMLKLKTCEAFCKKDYVVEMNKVFKKSAKKYNVPYKSPTKQENVATYNTCKKTFCNENCHGYDFFGDKEKQMDFKKNIKNGFQNTYSRKKMDMLKKRGALSGCMDVIDYDVFHK
jgi:hypothetical protein